ncbi:glycosyltransferase family 4 protein [Rhodococcus sp. IEGM 1408]|uniref:glycosyltransferase n=1 Tax=Rhodococcus sp. IEGM 1408 TaxID=3082220 RepID=UPI00295440DD|nr:glycosyltransferase family 4 protein [Rhodococcus sp. IEGM 1408]MDV8001441.1 glycosyltransferase family 4 protein [Rhodococcus sp. IEGM 1408]
MNTDEYRFSGVKGDSCCAINVGRPEEAKNRRRLIPISEELTRRGSPPIRVIGRPGYDLSSADEPTIEFVGPVAPIRPEYEKAGCLVVVSTREGLPGVVLEALACGVPVVSSRLSGVEMLARSLEGITIVGLDESDACWADAITQAFKSRRSADAMLIASSVRSSEFSLSNVTAHWLSELKLSHLAGRIARS